VSAGGHIGPVLRELSSAGRAPSLEWAGALTATLLLLLLLPTVLLFSPAPLRRPLSWYATQTLVPMLYGSSDVAGLPTAHLWERRRRDGRAGERATGSGGGESTQGSQSSELSDVSDRSFDATIRYTATSLVSTGAWCAVLIVLLCVLAGSRATYLPALWIGPTAAAHLFARARGGSGAAKGLVMQNASSTVWLDTA
jgi:hypothetical protein